MLGKRGFLIASGAGSAGVALSASGVESAAGAERPKDAAQDGDRAAVKLAHDHHTRAVRAIRKGQGDARYLLKKGTKPAVVRERQRHHDDIATKHLLQAIALRPGWIHLYHQLVPLSTRSVRLVPPPLPPVPISNVPLLVIPWEKVNLGKSRLMLSLRDSNRIVPRTLLMTESEKITSAVVPLSPRICKNPMLDTAISTLEPFSTNRLSELLRLPAPLSVVPINVAVPSVTCARPLTVSVRPLERKNA